MKKWTYILLIGSILGLGIPGTLFANEKAIVVDGEWSNDPIGWRFNAVSASLPPKELGSHAFPKLSFAEDKGYAQDPNGKGIHPNKGTANKTSMTFKVIYTHENNEAPTSAHVIVKPTNGATTTLPLTAVSSHASSTLADGIYANGEQYAAATTFPKGEYTYHFEVSDGTATTTFPANETLSFTTGYSNVALVPGIQASRLYEREWGLDDQLWEPDNDSDAEALSLKDGGDDSIYVPRGDEGVIDQFHEVTLNIYESFIDDLDDWKDDDLINDYAALPYDWRYGFDMILDTGSTIVSDDEIYYGSPHYTNTPFILEKLRELAATSDNGKVTIVAHSMGGLLTKKMLADIEADPNHKYRDLLTKVDTVVLAGSPQLGTPKAVASSLHGHDQELGIPGIYSFITAPTARRLARDFPSVYTLLPSQTYFDRVTEEGEDPAIATFDPDLSKVLNDPLYDPFIFFDEYGRELTSYSALTDFLTGSEGRTRPPKDDLTHPETLRADLIADAQNIHDQIDDWNAPDMDGDGSPDIDIVQIAGWGKNDTVRGIEYSAIEKEKLASSCRMTAGLIGLFACPKETTYEFTQKPQWTHDGDGTVTLPSAVAMRDKKNVETYYVNLFKYNDGLTKNREHADILEVPNVRALIENILAERLRPGKKLSHVKNTESDLPKEGINYTRLSLHSPVAIDIYDQDNRHVGVATSSSATKKRYDEEVPNSYYLRFGEGKYLGIPLEDNNAYTIDLSGTGTGTFTLTFTHQSGGTTTDTHTFTNVPVSTTTEASLSYTTVDDAQSLTLDYDGDGTPDTTVFSDEHAETVTFDTLRTAIKNTDTTFRSLLLAKTNAAARTAENGTHHAAWTILGTLNDHVAYLSGDNVPDMASIEKPTALRIQAIIAALAEREKQQSTIPVPPFSSSKDTTGILEQKVKKMNATATEQQTSSIIPQGWRD